MAIQLIQHFTRKSKPLFWEAEVQGDSVIIRYGVLDGKMQTTTRIPGSRGKPGTRSYISPEMQAKIELDRLVKKRYEEGYSLHDVTAVNISSPEKAEKLELSKNICFPKPIKELPISKFEKIYGGVTDLDFCFTRKRNGMAGILAHMEDGIHVFSRRMDDITGLVPHIAQEAESWLPQGSIIMGELLNPEEHDDFQYISQILRSLPERATSMQSNTGRYLQLYVFQVFVWGGKEVWYKESIESLLRRVYSLPEGQHIKPMEIIGLDDLDQVKELLKSKDDWEGAVIYLREGFLGREDVSYSGKERRPPVYWKFKLAKEDDFIITDWDVGTGKNMHRLGKVRLGKYNGSQIVDFGWCGTGFSDEQRDKYADDFVLGKVVQIEYESLTPDGKLRFPNFIRFRLDKDAEECTA